MLRAMSVPPLIISRKSSTKGWTKGIVTPNPLVLRRREAASKDAPPRTDGRWSWIMLRDTALARGPRHEVSGVAVAGAIRGPLPVYGESSPKVVGASSETVGWIATTRV